MARRLVGQLGLKDVRPDYDEVMAEFVDEGGPDAKTVKAVKGSLRQLAESWLTYERELPMGRILRELAREFKD